jgi:hypothetical protein
MPRRSKQKSKPNVAARKSSAPKTRKKAIVDEESLSDDDNQFSGVSSFEYRAGKAGQEDDEVCILEL